MRLYLKTTPSEGLVPFSHLPMLSGALHRWLGPGNKEHDKLSLYSFSWLQGSKVVQDALTFPGGASWFISFFDRGPVSKIVKGILDDPEVGFGMKVTEVNIREIPRFSNKERFHVAGPVFIKRDNHDGIDRHILYTDEEADSCLTETMINKLRTAGLDYQGVKIYFDHGYEKARTQLVQYKKMKNKASLCPVFVEGTPEQVAFVWLVGVGNSTGIGFGALV